MKKLLAVGTLTMALALSSITVFAAPFGQRNNPQGIGRGSGGTGQGLGIGGQMLQDGSCYYVGEDGKLYYTETKELVPEDAFSPGCFGGGRGAGQGLGIGGMRLQDGSCYLVQ